MGLRIAFFGQAPFGKDVLVELADAGHTLAGVYVPPDGARPDPCAAEAAERGLPLFRHRRFRRRGAAIPEIVAEYGAIGADLNVLAFVTAILPVEIIDGPKHKSLCFHPSLLPRFRGGAALAWQIIEGEKESGVTVFQPDAGVDTGPIILQEPIPLTYTRPIEEFEDQVHRVEHRLLPRAIELIAEGAVAIDSENPRLVRIDER